MKAGDKVSWIKKSDRQQSWAGTVLMVLEETNEVVVAWIGERSGRKVRQVNSIDEVTLEEEAATTEAVTTEE